VCGWLHLFSFQLLFKKEILLRKLLNRLSWIRIIKNNVVLVALSFGHGISDWYLGTLYMILPYFAKDLGLTYSEVGILMGWNSLSSFFVNLPGGMIVDTVGKTGMILGLALALTGLPYFLLGFSPNYVVAIIVVTFIGVGSNLWHPAAISFLAKRYPDRKGFAMSVHMMGGHLGNTLSPLAIGVALTFLTWRKVLILNVIPGILMGLLLWALLAKTGMVKDATGKKGLALKDYWEAVKTMARNKSILLLCVLSGMRSMTQSGLFTFLPLYLAYELKYSPPMVGVYISVIRIAGIFASPISGAISDKKGRRPILSAGLIVTSLLLVSLGFFRLTFLFIGVLGCLGFFLFSLHPVMQAWMMDLAPKNVGGTTVSAMFGIQSLFASITPPICGLIADRFGILYAFYFLAATILAANFIVYLIPEKSPKIS
jgi:MFS transporter, FSR family, fosmidomycin resistance protein